MFDEFYYVIEDEMLFKVKGDKFYTHIEEICILQSVLKYYSNKFKCFNMDRFRPIFKNAKKLMIDSGGFNILKHYPDYPFSNKQYNRFLNELNPDSAVCMDYNIIILKEIIGDSPEARKPYIMKTIDNYVTQYDMDRNYELIIPIQGIDFDEQLNFIDMLSERIDLKKVEYWGIGGGGAGGLSGSQWADEVMRLRSKICKILNKRFNFPKIHNFGLSFSYLKKMFKYKFKITSADSWNWAAPIKVGTTFDDNGKAIPIRKTKLSITVAKQRCLTAYKHKMKELQELLIQENNEESFF